MIQVCVVYTSQLTEPEGRGRGSSFSHSKVVEICTRGRFGSFCRAKDNRSKSSSFIQGRIYTVAQVARATVNFQYDNNTNFLSHSISIPKLSILCQHQKRSCDSSLLPENYVKCIAYSEATW